MSPVATLTAGAHILGRVPWREERLHVWEVPPCPSWAGEQFLKHPLPANHHPSPAPWQIQGCLAQHFLEGFLVAIFQGRLSALGPYKGSFDEKFGGK